MAKKVDVFKVVAVSAGIILSVIGYAHWRGAFDGTVSASTSENTDMLKEHDKRLDLVEKDNVNLNGGVRRIEESFKDFRTEQRKHNTLVIEEIRGLR